MLFQIDVQLIKTCHLRTRYVYSSVAELIGRFFPVSVQTQRPANFELLMATNNGALFYV